MSGVHRLFGNNLSVIKDGTLTPSSVKTSSAIFQTELKRKGSGVISLLGNYTGFNDAIYELRIVSEEGAGRITQPIFTGVGSGVLSGIAISGIPLQDFIIRLTDLGIDTLNAEFNMGDIVLRAKTSGAAGNEISISVNEDELVYTTTTFATLEEMPEGTVEFKGPQWDWNTVVLNSKGEIPADGMRLKFENDPQIYRQYKLRRGSDWMYCFSPGIVRTIPEGSKVYEVTGHRRVVITDGIINEQYPHVITLYDFATQVYTESELVEVLGAIVDDKTPGGMNCQDFPFTTTAYLHPIKMEGSKYVQRLDEIELQEIINTEILEIECVDNVNRGAEIWSVNASITGSLPQAQTDELYLYGPVHFKIPKVVIEGPQPEGEIGFSLNYESRSSGEITPPICLERRIMGAKSKTGLVSFTWTKNIGLEECACENVLLEGVINNECLGLEEEEGGEIMDGIDVEYKNRLQLVHDYISGFTQSNTYFYNETSRRGWKVTANRSITKFQFDDCTGESAPHSSEKETYKYETEGQARDKAADLEAKTWCNNKFWYEYKNIAVERIYNYIGGAEADLKFMHSAMAILLDSLSQIYEIPPALVIWDSLLSEVKVDLNYLKGSTSKDPGTHVRHVLNFGSEYLERYQAKANLALLAAGIVPGKGRSSSKGAACWSEQTDPYYWKASDGYLPAYNNSIYYSAKLDNDGEIQSTQEFAFVIVCACPQHLKEGDKIIVSFNMPGGQVSAYQLGDKFSIPIIAAKDLELFGGVDGNDTYTWKVSGSISGELPDYLSVDGLEEEYNQSGLRFLIQRGGIPFELGDQWSFSIEGGKFQWRKDSGAWSSNLDVGPHALSDGIHVMFLDGSAPSFKSGDISKFKVLQPNSAEHIKHPTTERWIWIGSSGTLTIDCNGLVSVSEIFVADHNIPSTATVLIEGSQDGFSSTDWSYPMVWNKNVLTKVLSVTKSVTHLRLKVTNANSCYIGWICAGIGLTTLLTPKLFLSRQYASITSNNILAGGSIPMGAGWGGELAWENSMSSSEFTQLLELLDHLKQNNNEPVILLPHILHEEEGRICQIDVDSVEIRDIFNYQPDAQAKRILSVTIPLEPVFL